MRYIYKRAGLIMLVVIISLCQAFNMLETVETAETAAPLTKRVLVNAAQFKPVSASGSSTAYAPSNITDGDVKTYWSSAGSGNRWIQVDLQRYYKVEKIQVIDKQESTTAQSRSYFEVLASRTSDFSEGTYTRLGGIEALNNDIFPDKGSYSITLGTPTSYRFIRLRKTNTSDCSWSEIRVYAMQTVTEVSRGKQPTEACSESSSVYASRYANDGINDTASSTGWAKGDTTTSTGDPNHRHWWRVDLGQAYNIGMIEIEDRVNNGDAETRRNINIYGSEIASLNDADLSKLCSITSSDPNYYTWQPGGTWQATTNTDISSRYITYRKSINGSAYIAEFRAFVVNPEVMDVANSVYGGVNNNYVVDFSDEMDESTLNPQTIKLMKTNDNKEISYTKFEKTSTSYTISIPDYEFDTEYKIVVSTAVKNLKNVAIAENYESRFKTKKEFEISDFTFINTKDTSGTQIEELQSGNPAGARVTIKSNKTTGSKGALLIVALFNQENSLEDIVEISREIEIGEQVTIGVGLDVPAEDLSGYKLIAYIWDDYDSLKPWVDCITIPNGVPSQ